MNIKDANPLTEEYSMTPEQQIEHVREFLVYAARADWQGGSQLMHEDFVIIEPSALPYAGDWRTPDGFVEMMKIFGEAWSKWRDTPYPYPLASVSNLVFKEVRFRATLRKTGNEVEMDFGEVFEFRDEKIIAIRPYYRDPSLVARANQ